MATATVLTTYIYRLLNFLRMGTTGVTAQAVGRGDRQALLMVGLDHKLHGNTGILMPFWIGCVASVTH
ncbi:hypothetical protein [Brasilonema sp. UFV-L1]|uniref:hypothetical protein n=1 Tax=Brasilonema sp. UFV-L1 TaxID=2234130 RepID=UPI001B7D1CED|nr:hypothetical protein [Brasilonema sp. UFV-L1]